MTMNHQQLLLVSIFILSSQLISIQEGFAFHASSSLSTPQSRTSNHDRRQQQRHQVASSALLSTVHNDETSSSASTSSDGENDANNFVEIRQDIQRMKEEAAQRLDALNERFKEVESMRASASIAYEAKEATAAKTNDVATTSSSSSRETTKTIEESLTDKADEFHRDMKELSSSVSSPSPSPSIKVNKKRKEEDIVSSSSASGTKVSSKSISKSAKPKRRTSVSDLYPERKTVVTKTKTTKEATGTGTSATMTNDTTTTTTVVTTTTKQRKHHPLKLLDDTRWRMMLNVGRVPGSWMPKTWGASGDKINMKLEVEFTSKELYEREDFFYSRSDGSKILKVINDEAYMAPNLREGGKSIRFSDGGWKIMEKEGPLETSVLRFYFNVEEEARHLGSDVYLPAGRVYGTCGYFPMTARSNQDLSTNGISKRDAYENELRQLDVRYQSLQTQQECLDDDDDNDDDSSSDDDDNSWRSSLLLLNTPFIRKLKLTKKMMDVQEEASRLQKLIKEEKIREPSKDTLRLSQDQLVGLTKEGGICCKKTKGLSQEYRILGKFVVASMENRDHSNYDDVLRP